jgi:hypothetical protein
VKERFIENYKSTILKISSLIKTTSMSQTKKYFNLFIITALLLTSCGIYKFNDASIDPAVKTIKLGFIENRARYVNPQLSPKLNDKWQLKIASQTKLTRTTSDDAHYIISGTITNYDASQTVGVSNQGV